MDDPMSPSNGRPVGLEGRVATSAPDPPLDNLVRSLTRFEEKILFFSIFDLFLDIFRLACNFDDFFQPKIRQFSPKKSSKMFVF